MLGKKIINRVGIDYKRKRFPYIGCFDIKELEMDKSDKFPIKVRENKQFKQFENKAYNLNKREDLVFDFGEEFVGDCYYKIQGEGKLTFVYGESLDEAYSTIEQTSCSWYRLPLFTIDIIKEKNDYKSCGRRGFRYIRIKCEDGSVTINSIKVVAEHVKIKNKNSFEGLSDELKKINDICERTTRLCMQQWLEDGVKRDGMCWISDARLIAICNYALFGGTEIVKNSLLYFAESQQADGIIYPSASVTGALYVPERINYMYEFGRDPNFKGRPDYCDWLYPYVQYIADYINLAWEYYEFSGDKELLETIFPFVKRAFNKLITMTPKQEFAALLPAPGQAREGGRKIDQGGFLSTYYAFFVYSAKNYIKVCELFNENSEIVKAQEQIERYKERHLSFYKDGYVYDKERNGYYCSPESAHIMGFLAGIINREQYLKARSEGNKAAPSKIVDGYWEYWKIRAMFEAGLTKEAEEEISEYWGTMLKYDATTCWEHYDKDNMYILDDFIISRCHGWSAGASDLIKRYILKDDECKKYARTFNENN